MNEPQKDQAPNDVNGAPRHDAYSRRSSNWLIWIAVGAVILIGIYGLVTGLAYSPS